MTDREAFYEFANGVALIIGTVGLFVLFMALIGTGDEKPTSTFKVVDKYNGCDVVRYTDRSNSWHYFLHCHE